jgi:hypothetical protein
VERKGTFEQVRRRGWRAKRALQIRVHLILQSVAPLGDLFNGIYSMGFIQWDLFNGIYSRFHQKQFHRSREPKKNKEDLPAVE